MNTAGEAQDRCPLCGRPTQSSSVNDPAALRIEILRLRQRLDELERTGEAHQGAEPAPASSDQDLQERIDRGLQGLEGGYGMGDQPWT
jgi:hypothetical protein